MPGIDVSVRRVINAPRDLIADFTANPDNAPVWSSNIRAVNWHSERPAQIGSKMEFETIFLGRKLSHIFEIIDLVPGKSLHMRTTDAAMTLETSYEWSDVPAGCEMTVCNRGQPDGFAKVAAPIMARAMRRSANRDLGNLARLTEAMFGPFTS